MPPRPTFLTTRLTPLFSSLFSHSQSPYFSFNSNTPFFFRRNAARTLTTIASSSSTSSSSRRTFSRYRKSQSHHLSTLAEPTAVKLSTKARRRIARGSPEGILKHKLDECSKTGNLVEALRLYDAARNDDVSMNLDHYNKLLYLCSASELGLKRGMEIFQQMLIDRVLPNEATFTNAARLAAAKNDPDMAFELLKRMKDFAIAPKLRSYGPALYGFCKKGDANKAYEVDADMIDSGIVAEESELSALLEVSVSSNREDKVYEMLQRLRTTVRQVSESTFDVIESWFNKEFASKIGEKNWDVNRIREGIERGGGGWHGQGWLGSGQWKVAKTHVNQDGHCLSCGEKLVSIDIDPKETEDFADSLSILACKKDPKLSFIHFKKWLKRYGPFDAVVDGANIGLADGQHFSFARLRFVVEELRQMSPTKRLPLIILHVNRVNCGPALSPNNRRLIESWKKNGVLYATPQGSNDDWYWLYAAVRCKCLLLTNDEMRDHLFQLLGSSFFPRWKEKHQVRVSTSTGKPVLIPPPCYSIVIQESANGNWHVPSVTGDDLDIPRKWLCASRSREKSLHNLWKSTSTTVYT
ncbi:hypothetical protein HN51_026538 [Arachis hypogaea]